MIEPYQAIGLVPTMWGVRHRDEIAKNLDHLEHLFKAAFWLGGLDQPVRLVAIPEGALQGFTDEVMDLDHELYASECAIDIPGPETDRIGDLAKKWNVYVMAQAKARHPEFPGRFFNVGFIISPDGEVILRHHKVVPLLPVEHSMTPHNVWDRWVELYGETLDAFYPVVDTEIGRLGIMMANEGSYPENARGLAMNGAEVVYRASFPHRASDAFEIQTRARALDNNLYVIAPNLGTYYLTVDSETPIDTFGGGSLIVDHQGRVIGRLAYSGASSWVAGTIDVEGLRCFRTNSRWGNWMKDLTTEQYRLIYDQPVYPKNLYLDRVPYMHEQYRTEVLEPQIRALQERGVYAKPDQAERNASVGDSRAARSAGYSPATPPAVSATSTPPASATKGTEEVQPSEVA
jgi:predicted amidohydrolase